jgi:histidinol-phosphate aminotransferase
MSMCDVLSLARPEIRALKPYSSARMEAPNPAVPLNANESPWPPPGIEDSGLNRYPAPQPARLRARLAALYDVRDEQVLLTRGSGEGIDLLLRGFCRPGCDAVVTSPPTFGLYTVCAAIQGAATIAAPLNQAFAPSRAAVCRVMNRRVKLVFLCSPNNPTGKLAPSGCIAEIAAALAGRALLVVDEAYIEFSGAPSAATLLDRHVNLVVLRTLSKAWGLAGARIGALLACAEIVDLLRRILAPYPLAAPAIAAALAALRHREDVDTRLAALRRERERVATWLAGLSCVLDVLPSDANFLAVRFRDAGHVLERLARAGIAIRDLRGHPRLDDALRITIGRAEQNDFLLAMLAKHAPARQAVS